MVSYRARKNQRDLGLGNNSAGNYLASIRALVQCPSFLSIGQINCFQRVRNS